MNNPEKLATLGTQDTDEDKKEKENHTTQKTKKDEQHGPNQKPGVNSSPI
jgi:hypothetical protein